MQRKTLQMCFLALVLSLLGCILSGCGGSSTPGGGETEAQTEAEAQIETQTDTEAQAQTETETETEAQNKDASHVADASDMAEVADVVPEGLRPVYGADLRDGTYFVAVDSSSSMFRITDCILTVSGGNLTAVMTMGGTGYLYVYPGTAEEAAEASEAEYIPYVENADGAHTFTIPVTALDAGVPCAAFSKKRELWYDRTLRFRADSLPLDAFAEGVLTTVESLGLADGEYQAEVELSGGSGRASIQSPASVRVAGGTAEARIIWNSDKYDYMVVDGNRIDPCLVEDGCSHFVIPVAAFDVPLSVTADTTAMSQPHEIEYTLLFSSSTLQQEPDTPSDD